MRMIFSAGTAAELIKLYPVIAKATEHHADWTLLFSGQAPISFFAQWEDFGLPKGRLAHFELRDHDLKSGPQAAKWFAKALAVRTATLTERLGALPKGTPWVVHGDTLSTLWGAITGRRLGCTVAHVEAGLRSFHLREPFPEEIVRTSVAKIARAHFPPELKGRENLLREGAYGPIVQTQGNTQLDAVDLVLAQPAPADLPKGEYALVNIHRYETLLSPERKARVKETLLKAARGTKLIVVSHATTLEWLRTEPEFKSELESHGAVLLPRQPFSKFAHWLARAQYVIADSGGNQQECAHLGIPCLLLRQVTESVIERKCVVLSQFDSVRIDAFLADPQSYREPAEQLAKRPAEQIWETLSTMPGVA
jgi:UDP-N-acetylglucosamine 2-epimerase (non-hydrolysing)